MGKMGDIWETASVLLLPLTTLSYYLLLLPRTILLRLPPLLFVEDGRLHTFSFMFAIRVDALPTGELLVTWVPHGPATRAWHGPGAVDLQ